MSQTNHPTHSREFFWVGPSAPNQRTSSADTWLRPGLPQESSFTTPDTHGSRQGDASINDNAFVRHGHVRRAHEPLSISGGPNAVPGFYNPGSTSQSGHGDSATTTTNQEIVGSASAQRRKPKTRTSDAQWQQNKPHIEKLYMKDKLPLPEVMKRMKRDHDFDASEKMYKTKFKSWRWSKNLPQDIAAWMTKKQQQRNPTKTVFSFRGQEWNGEQVEEKYRNQLFAVNPAGSNSTPNEIQYWTPQPPATSPCQPRIVASQSHDTTNQTRESPKFYLDTQPVNFDLNGAGPSDLRNLLREASRAASEGRTDEANADFRDAVSGFASMLSPTHPETLRAGYLYASFYANYNDMNRADAVLNWMSGKHVERWGSRHENTYLHYARMIELLRSWGRLERAELLVYKLLDGMNEDGDETFLNFSSARSGSEHRRSIADINPERLFTETDDPESVSDQLSKIDLAIMADITGLDHVLEVMIRHCEDKSDDQRMSLQACRAKCALAKVHTAAGQVEKTHQALNSAKRSLAPLLAVGEEPMSRATMKMARQLSLLFFKAKDESSCKAVLDEVIAALEARRHIPACEREREDVSLLDFVTEIAFQFHENASSDMCRYWAERGLGLAIKLHGRKSCEARRFLKILEKNDFGMRTSTSVDDLMSFSGGFFNIRLVSNPGS
ncbi:hypothetical protein CDV36_009797 [Fusarium kuroshium]|uniref:Clr5 domain-containing protein n=1 Tax=Fusarium kuroshium TaxID=2010991 RepID=A0A3M2RZ47_9HYPO|nr:hypothetical protein CDV36_009797 [Fusarium kuroshium]